MKLEFSFDDGDPLDVRVAELLERHGFTATFYIPSLHKISVKDLEGIAKVHELGGHTVTHPHDLKALSTQDLYEELDMNREYLKDMFGKLPSKFCYPRGRYNDKTIEALKDVGYTQARTTIVLKIDIPQDPFRYDTTIHCAERDEYEGVGWFEVATSLFQKAKEKGDEGYFHVWGHAWEIEENNEWDTFDNLLIYIKVLVRNIC